MHNHHPLQLYLYTKFQRETSVVPLRNITALFKLFNGVTDYKVNLDESVGKETVDRQLCSSPCFLSSGVCPLNKFSYYNFIIRE